MTPGLTSNDINAAAKHVVAEGARFAEDCKANFDQPEEAEKKPSNRKAFTVAEAPGQALGLDTLIQLELDRLNEHHKAKKFTELVIDRDDTVKRFLG